ncbi:MAG TPA: hypothetical protein VGJ44_14325 [Kribbellaceae bacterium]|jgi:hypothetical protein
MKLRCTRAARATDDTVTTDVSSYRRFEPVCSATPGNFVATW